MRQSDLKMVPANFGPLKDADSHAGFTGPCGDTMNFWIRVADDKVVASTFTSDGCETSLYCGSAVAEDIIGKGIDEVSKFKEDDFTYILKELEVDDSDCVKLALITLKMSASEYLKQNCSGACKSCSASDCDTRVKTPNAESVKAPNIASAIAPDAESIKAPNAESIKAPKSVEQKRKNIVVLSGKGGVGKSTVAVNLAVHLAGDGQRVGLIDIDFHGPSVPVMLGIKGTPIESDGDRLKPYRRGNLKVMSIGFLLSDSDAPVIWRGPMKMGAITQFLKDVEWGELDYLIVDCPPGTGDEPLSICQALEGEDTQALIVTTPQEVAASDVRRSVNFCRKMELPIAGIIENMSGFQCPHCQNVTDIFSTGGGRQIAEAYNIPFLGELPISDKMGIACDGGKPFVEDESKWDGPKNFGNIVEKIINKGA